MRIARVVSVATVCLAFVASAVPAKAAPIGLLSWNGTSLSTTTLTGAVNDTFLFSNNDPSPGTVYVVNDVAGGAVSLGGTPCTQTMPGQSPCAFDSSTSGTLTVTGLGDIRVYGAVATLLGVITIAARSPAPPSEGGASSLAPTGPAQVVQQFGAPGTGSCDDAQPEGLDWAGVPSGGWSASWAEWLNGGRGGAVCTRTLVYSDALGAWTLG